MATRRYQEGQLSDQNLLESIKLERENAEKGVNNLLGQISQKHEYFDELRYLGDRYTLRLKEFQLLRSENQDLKMETRKLQEQLGMLRNSMQESGWKEEDLNRFSVDRRQESTYHHVSSEPSARELLKDKMSGIDKMIGDARSQYADQQSEYDQLLKSVLHFLEMAKNTKDLFSEMKQASGEAKPMSDQDLVMVPRKRYELLIEIYAANMAEVSAKELQKHLEGKEGKEASFDWNQYQGYKQKYTNIASDEKLELSSMKIFFAKLAERFGFTKEWERYHTENEQESVRIKNEVDSIIKPSRRGSPQKLIENASEKDKEAEKQAEPDVQDIRNKLNALFEALPFSKKEKNVWQNLSERIHNDRLFSMDRLLQLLKDQEKQLYLDRIGDYAQVMNTIFSNSISQFQGLLLSKYKQSLFQKNQLEGLFATKELSTSLEKEMQKREPQELLDAIKSLSRQIFEKITSSLKKQLVFVNTGQLSASFRRRK